MLMLYVLHLNRSAPSKYMHMAAVFMYMLTCYEHSQCAAYLLLELLRLSMICPANCSGRGRCDFTLSTPQCECFDRSDTSPLCLSSPFSFAPTISPAPTLSARPSVSPTITPRPTEANSSSSIMRSDVALGSMMVLLLLFGM